MKVSSLRQHLSLILSCLAISAQAATQTWNPGGAGGGGGSWNANNWDSSAAWTSGNTAVFSGSPGTVNLQNTTQTVADLTFLAGGYSIVGGTTGTGTLVLSGTTTTFTTTSGTTTLGGVILSRAVGGQMYKTGPGALALSQSSLGALGTSSIAVWTVTGGTLLGGVYDSILSITAGNNLGVAPSSGAVQVVLDAGTLIDTGEVFGQRQLQVNAAGGTLQFAGGAGNKWTGNIFNNADSSHTLYLNATESGVKYDVTNSAGTGPGIISGAGSVTKIGPGTVALSGVSSNTFAGGMIIASGTLINNSTNNTIGSGTLVIGDAANTGAAASFQYAGSSANTAFANAISVTGNGLDVLSATNWNPIFNGAVSLGNNLTILSNNTNGSNLTFNGGFTGTGNVTVSIDGANAFSYVTIGGAGINNTGSIIFNNAAVGSGVAGTGTGVNTISGPVGSNVTGITQASSSNPLLVSGTLNVNNAGTTLAATGTTLFTVSGGVAGTGNLFINANTTGSGILVSNGSVNHSGLVTNSGTGSAGTTISSVIGSNVTGLVENSANSVLTLSGSLANTYGGVTTVSNGTLLLQKTAGVNAIPGDVTLGDGTHITTLLLGANDQIADTSVITMIGTLVNQRGLLRMVGFNETIGGISSSTQGAGVLENSGGAGTTSTLTINVASGTQTFSGIARDNNGAGGTLAITKSGDGTQVFSGNDSYTGRTTVNGGTLAISGSVTGSTNITVNSPGILQLNNASLLVTSGSTTINGTLSLKGSTTTGKLAFFDGSTLASTISGTAAGSFGSAHMTGAMALTGSITLSIDSSAYTPVYAAGNLDASDKFALTLGTATPTGSIANFGNVASVVDSNYGLTLNEFTDASGHSWAVFYGVNYASTSTWTSPVAGNDLVVVSVAAVPEPGTWGMLLVGLGTFVGLQRKRVARMGIRK